MVKRFVHIVGTRPNFIKAAPVIHEMNKTGWKNEIIHTGQHYDAVMSDVFFAELNLPKPDHFLGTTAVPEMIEKIGDILVASKWTAAILYGDVHSSLAGCIAAMNLDIPIIHVESGLRSGDKTMPEERNRVVIDHMAKYRFCTETAGLKNLISEGLTENNYLVGNTALDSLRLHEPKVLPVSPYILLTLHRPFNVDDPERLNEILRKLDATEEPIIFPVHPRTKQYIKGEYKNIEFIDPVGYVEFLRLIARSHFVITDSGGIQCEACTIQRPIFTLRPHTEHQMTIDIGANKLITIDDITLEFFIDWIMNKWKPADGVIEWDGKAAVQLVEKLKELL